MVGLASPTLLNNIITRFGTGIGGATGSTVVRSNHFQDNGSNGPVGTDPILAAPTAPLFIDAAADNYILDAASLAVDNSLNTFQDRFNYVNFKEELAIPPSPMRAPDRDLFGQLRVDSSSGQSGGGSQVFKDRGAIDLADQDRPYAVLRNPVDNDQAGLDRDPNATVVWATDSILEDFRIFLGDGRNPDSPQEGTGADPLTVTSDTVEVRQNGRPLVEGVDYVFAFNASTREMRLTPLSTLWEPSSVYDITLDNHVITDRVGNRLRGNRDDGSTTFTVILPDVAFDFGDAPASYGTLLVDNGARHAWIDDATPRLGLTVDREQDGQPFAAVGTGSPATGGDDLPPPVQVSSTVDPSALRVTGDGADAVSLQFLAGFVPATGDTIVIDLGRGPTVFEFVPVGVAPTPGNLAVRFDPADSPDVLAAELRSQLADALLGPGDAVRIELDPDDNATVSIHAADDEDGVAVGTLNNGIDRVVFLEPGTEATTNDPTDVLGFLNPLDPAGARVAVEVTGSGFLDVWVDFDGDGTFHASQERGIDRVAVSDGWNVLTIHTPPDANEGETYARFRLSPEGGLLPTGLTVGGEVEDHVVEVIPVPLPVPNDDRYEIAENSIVSPGSVLDTVVAALPSVLNSDTIDDANFTPIDVIVDQPPSFAANFELDPRTGHFRYQPLPNFVGIDTFTYRLANQTAAAETILPSTLFATVSIDVRPVNDPPLAQDQSFTTREDTSVTITADDLLQGAVPHFNPLFPVDGAESPFDESNQSLRVISVQAGSTAVTAANADDGPFATENGVITATFDESTGWLVELSYLPNTDLNRDNADFVPFDSDSVFDHFDFTIEDDGVSIDPATFDPVTGEVLTDVSVSGTPRTHAATAVLDVAPQNDDPVADNDYLSVGTIGAGVSDAPIDPSTDWGQYLTLIASDPDDVTIPIPTEDEPLLIPSAFLLRNDESGRPTAADEVDFVNDNDGPLTVISVEMVTPGDGTVSIDEDGNVVFVPPSHEFGEIVFRYVAEDQGVNEDIDGNRVVSPLTHEATVTVMVQPVNDPPVGFDRSLRFDESSDPGASGPYTFTPDDLLLGSVDQTPARPGPSSDDFPFPFDESEQSLRLVRFRTDAGAVDVADLDDYTEPGTGNGTLSLASDAGGTFEFDFVDGTFTEGRFVTSDDYDERTPFAAVERLFFTIEDDGLATDPQTGEVVTLATRRSEEESELAIHVTQANDAPVFEMPELLEFDENEGEPVIVSEFLFDVAPGPFTALDELERQNIEISVTPINVPDGMMTELPAFELFGSADGWIDGDENPLGTATLTVFPAADAFGFAVYEVTLRDDDPDNPREFSRTVTIAVNPVNDAPAAFDRAMRDVESVEFDGETTVIPFDADRLIIGDGVDELGSVPGVFPDDLDEPYNEQEQSLRVVRFEVPGADPIDVDVDEPGLVDGTGEVTRTTPTGATLTFRFDSGAFVSGTYEPAIDYSELTPFDPTDTFTYVIKDDGQTTLPGSGFVEYEGSDVDSTIFIPELRSELATVTFTIEAANDPPVFEMPELLEFDENEGEPVIVSEFLFDVAPGPFTALDELERQNIEILVTPINVPDGMMTELPAFELFGSADGWIDGDENPLGTATLTVFPAADAFGFAVYEVTLRDDDPDNPREFSRTVTIAVHPVNDAPAAFDRAMRDVESVEFDGETTVIPFDADRLIVGDGVDELGSVPGVFPDDLDEPYNEQEQSLRVVRFEVPGADPIDVDVDEPGLVDGTGEVTRTTPTGATLTFRFDSGAFVSGTYEPAIDYNERTPFDPTDTFTYVIKDDGQTTLPGSGFVEYEGSDVDSTIFIPELRSEVATVTFTIEAANDPPVFGFESEVHVLERDDNGETVIADWATGVLPGPATALDELQRQSVSFEFVADASDVPVGLFRMDPVVTPDGTLSVFPSPDAVGTATVVMRATDFEDDPEFVPRSTEVTFTIYVQPVNDSPRISVDVIGESDASDSDTAYAVGPDGTVRYTLREDNTQADASTKEFTIPLRRVGGPGFDQIGLLDVFEVGPANETFDDFPGGSQVLSLEGFEATTALGGTVTLAVNSVGEPQLLYVPPQDYNRDQGDVDFFAYTVIDESVSGGETYQPAASPFIEGTLVEDRLTATNRVEFALTPVNDRPEFELATTYVEAAEDTPPVQVSDIAIGIVAGPSTASDEWSGPTAQSVTFEVIPIDFVPGGPNDPFGAGLPQISPNGELTFQPLPDAFGRFEFEVRLIDSGAGPDDGRGDLNVSLSQSLTIEIRPVNDPPVRTGGDDPFRFDVAESDSLVILAEDLGLPADGASGFFGVGPDNEAADLLPQPGGNQMLDVVLPFPTRTAQGGTLEPLFDTDGTLDAVRYSPRPFYNGPDSFVFSIVDDGVTVDVGTGGVPRPDPLTIDQLVTFNVIAVNDPPVFDGAGDVESDEDSGPVTFVSWAFDVAAAPDGADDERDGTSTMLPQSVEFVITQVSGDPDLFVDPPTAEVNGEAATLRYETAVDANGTSTFEVFLQDDGPVDPVTGAPVRSEVRTFTVTVNAINDPPQFARGDDVTVDEDSGPYVEPWATDILPGPVTAIDELASQTVAFDVVTPVADRWLFAESGLPAIDSEGALTFTPADDAAGTTTVIVTPIDSEGLPGDPVPLVIEVVDINDPPVAVDVTVNTNEDRVLRIRSSQLTANDIDPDLITDPTEMLSVLMPPESFSALGARLTFDSVTGDLFYDPHESETLQAMRPGETLVDSFTYTVEDSQGDQDTATVVLNVAGRNDAPVTVDDSFPVNATADTLLRPLENDSDVDGTIDPMSIVITRQPEFGSLTLVGDGTVIYTPFSGFSPGDFFRYTVADDFGQASRQATVTLEPGTPPTANDDLFVTMRGETITLDVLANDLPQSAPLVPGSVSLADGPSTGQAVVAGDGSINFTAADEFVGAVTLRYTVTDENGLVSNAATAIVNVIASTLQNPSMPSDVNADGKVSALDALIIINRLSTSGGTAIPVTNDDQGPNFYDQNGDGLITAIDALGVINALSRGTSGGEGESRQRAVSPPPQRPSAVDNQRNSDPGDRTQSVATRDTRNRVADPFDETYGPEIGRVGDDVIDLIAARRGEDSAAESERAVDEALTLFDG